METKKNQRLRDCFNLKRIPQRTTEKLRSCVGLCSLLPDAQGEDYEEEQFAKRMKKKKSNGRRLS